VARIQLLAFGKLRAPGLREATDYYIRNLKPWTQLNEVELKQHELSDRKAASRAIAQQKEAEKLDEALAKLDRARARVIVLDERGAQWSTEEWAKKIETWQLESVSDLAFCIGGTTGFDPGWVKKNAHATVSFGKQTTSHEIARLILSEQLYRAYSVLNGHPYHVGG
jgi:23S rRNA (pseudouridine1915-N3)-methyltransferase